VARAFAQILNQAEVNYAVLGEQEQCSGDSARRAGNEYLFNELAISNVEMLNQVAPKRIVTTCPHCLHTLKNEYPAFGGHYQVIHHTQLIYELIQNGQLKFEVPLLPSTTITFHDPCYLGRQNNILIEPRQVLQQANGKLVEMANHGMRSFCCGAGGAQMWKEEEQGNERVSHQRLRQAQTTAAETLAVACPFCMIMLTDAAKDAHANLQILDIAEIILPYIKPDAHTPDKTTIEKSARLK
jgi:Fe-S oxidoreductase